MVQRRSRLRMAGVAGIAAGALLAAGCSAASTSSNSSSGAPVKGAVATYPNINGAGANAIFPMEGSQFYSVTNYELFQYLMVRPLYVFGGNSNTSISVDYALSPADQPAYENGGKTVVINLKSWNWSDGSKVDAQDLIFFLNMLEAEKASYAGYTPGLLPDNLVSYSATGPQQVTIQLKQAYSSIWFTYNQLATLYPFPAAWDVTQAGAAAGSGGCATDTAADGWAKCKAVWSFLNAQNSDTSTYATNPLWQVVDGPFKLSAFNVDGNYTFVPNTAYSGSPKPSIAALKFVAYTDDTAIYTALKTGALSVGQVPATDLAPAAKGTFLPPSNPLASAGYSLASQYQFDIGFAYMNFNNPTYGPAFRQLYFRQALMMLNNQQGMSQAVGRNYWYPTSAGVPPYPRSQWVSPEMTANGGQGPYPYDPAKAKALLASHGWKLEGGVLTCSSSACGPGVKVGTQASFSMLYTSGISTQADMADILKSGLAQAGIQLTLTAETFDSLLPDTVPCTPTQSQCNWTFLYLGGWGFDGPGFEPTGEALYQTGVPNNSGSYSNPTMDSLIQATHTSNSLSTFDQFADYTATQVPALWMPWDTLTWGVNQGVHDVTFNPLSTFFPEYWACSTKSC
ncbi:MAG: ABC transporter substrate-binding protein [Streptosporangiaceae bacterium]